MKKYLIITIVTLMILFLVGCGTPQNVTTYNFKQGITEVNADFLQNSPPDKVYQNSNFKMIVKIDNQLAYHAKEGKVKIVGLDDKYFRLSTSEKTFSELLGRELQAPEGEKQFLEFDASSGQLFQNAEKYIANFYLTTSYNSNIDFTDTICINPSIYDVYNSGCKVQSSKTYSGQGAPLAVTKLEEIIFPVGTGAQLELRFQIQNKGKGKVQKIMLDKTSAKLGGKNLNCEFQGGVYNNNADSGFAEAILSDSVQKANLVCRVNLEDQSSYETSIILPLFYDYVLKERKRLTIIK